MTEANLREYARKFVELIAFMAPILIGLRFVTYMNQWVFFPYFPNVLDSALLCFSGFYYIFDKYVLEKS